jgi:hypothetical protein
MCEALLHTPDWDRLPAMHALPAHSYPGVTQRASYPLPPLSGEERP